MPQSDATPPPPERGTNVALLRGLLDSIISFHGLKPHVSEQIARHLHQNDVFALSAVPVALRHEFRRAARGEG